MLRAPLLVALIAATAACTKAPPPPPPAQQPAMPGTTQQAAGQAANAPTPLPAAIPFIEDDYTRALEEARARKVPLVVDVWAAWCHTCLSMRAFVFPNEAMRRRAADFVWLAIDRENDKNEAFLTQYPSSVLPTLWVIDAATEKPALKWLGSATAEETAALLDDAKLALASGNAGGEVAAGLLRGNQLSAQGKLAEAVKEYRAALLSAPRDWPRRAELVDALTERLSEIGDYTACVDLALAEIPALPLGTPVSDTAQTALSAAYSLPKEDTARGDKMRRMVEIVRSLATNESLPILADDRSSLFEHLVNALEESDRGASREAARQWASFLEAQAAKASGPAARAVFDSHRLEAYMALGQPERALPMLEQSAKDFPDDYNPHARLAVALLALGRHDEALVESDRALVHVLGPRRLRVLMTKADIYAAKGDKANERATLQAALEASKSMYGVEKTRAALEQRLAGK